MSILLIGQKSLPHPGQYYFPKEERQATRKVNRIKQVRYRTQLNNQIKQNQQRKLREQQRDKTLERQRQHAILKELQKKYENRQTSYKQWQAHKSFFERPLKDYQSRVLQDSKISSYNMPYLYYPYNYYWPNIYESEYWRSFNRPQYGYVRPNYHKTRTIKTQNSTYPPQSYDLSKSQVVQNPEDHIKQLRQYQNRKFKEVYELLDKSIDVFHEENQVPIEPVTKKRNSRLKKLNQKIKNKQKNAKIEEEKQFYELPYWSTKKPIKQTNEEDKEWRSWFAKQKLRELQQNSKNQRLRNEFQDRLMGLHKRIKSKIQQ